MEYYLINKNRKVMRFVVDSEGYFLRSIITDGDSPFDLHTLRSWIRDRVSGKGRYKFEQFDSTLVNQILNTTHGVSVTDSYWVRRTSEVIEWEDVSPYRYRGVTVCEDFNNNPVLALRGKQDKIIRFRGGLEILKEMEYSASNKGREYTFAEIYCDNIASMMGIESVHYMSEKVEREMFAVSPCITTESKGLVSYDALMGVKTINYEELLDYVDERDRNKILDMLLMDYLTCNTGRDVSNVHFYVSNDEHKVLGIAPMTFCKDSCLHGYDGSVSVRDYILSIRPADGNTWVDLFNLIDCDHVRERLDNLYNKYTCLSVSNRRDSLMVEMLETQLRQAKVKHLGV